MLDDTPAPLGDVTRRWACLDDGARDRHSVRLLGLDCPGDRIAHVETPKVDDGACYHRLVMAAIDGDPSPGQEPIVVAAVTGSVTRRSCAPCGGVQRTIAGRLLKPRGRSRRACRDVHCRPRS